MNIWSDLPWEEQYAKAEYTFNVLRGWCNLALKKSRWYRFTNWICYLPIPIIWRIGIGIESRFWEKYPDWTPALDLARDIILAAPIVRCLNYEGYARKIFKIEPL